MPVLPVTPKVVVTWIPHLPSARSPGRTGAHSTFDLVMSSGWHMGMIADVCLPAMIPATRAQASTSPLAALPSTIKSSVSGCMAMKPSATATRSVSGLAPTSTMRTWPLESICVSCFSSDMALPSHCCRFAVLRPQAPRPNRRSRSCSFRSRAHGRALRALRAWYAGHAQAPHAPRRRCLRAARCAGRARCR